MSTANQILLYCRAGFEKECAAEICEAASALGIEGYAKTKPDSAYVAYIPHYPSAMERLSAGLKWRQLTFARQLLFTAPLITELPVGDRVTPLLQAARDFGCRFRDVWLETADTNEAKELSSFCKKFEKPFRIALDKAGLLAPDEAELPRLHLFFLGSAAAFVAVSLAGNSSDWPLGIPRLRMPRAAPSRSTLKLAEAFMEFVGGQNAPQRLRAGQTAVDLGASPGGWTWQLVNRGLHVTAVDNGPMDKVLMASGMVEHLKTDAFHWRPKRAVNWLVCDMVEKPSRIAELVADWGSAKLFKEAIFNLKLPMKKRHEELQRCNDIIGARLSQAGIEYRLRFKQLYHDREEVTGHLSLR